MELTREERRIHSRETYRRVYRNFPNYRNRDVRIKLTREWIESYPPQLALSLLDIGCGRGEVVDLARSLGIKAVGCDIVPELSSFGRVDWIECATELPYKNEAFHLVTCTDVVEHLYEDDIPAALREMKRVSQGRLLITACHRHDTPGKYGDEVLHVTVRPRKWWADMIREVMGVAPTPLYLDRVNDNGTWFDVRCE